MLPEKTFRRIALVWSCALITWTVVQTFADPSEITTAVTTALGVVVGILSVVVGLYTHGRFKEGAEEKNREAQARHQEMEKTK